MASTTDQPAAAAGTTTIGGTLTVNRLGFGAMRITGPGVWDEPADRDEAVAVVRRAHELGCNLIDTADSYGPETSERIIADALHPYPDDLVIATKCGLTRQGPGEWLPVGRPEYLRQTTELSLRRLKLDAIPLQQLHRFDPQVPVAESLGALVDLQAAGKIVHIGISEVTEAQLREAQATATIVSVQNRYNLVDREWDAMVDVCAAEGITFIPWFPLAVGDLARHHSALHDIATAHAAAPSQVALAWLLRRSPAILPIPGTGSVAHLEENVLGATVALTDDEVAALDAAAA